MALAEALRCYVMDYALACSFGCCSSSSVASETAANVLLGYSMIPMVVWVEEGLPRRLRDLPAEAD